MPGRSSAHLFIPTLLALAAAAPVHASDPALLAEIRAMQARLVQLEGKVSALQQENDQLRAAKLAHQNASAAPTRQPSQQPLVSTGTPITRTEQLIANTPRASSTKPAELEALKLSGTMEIGAYASDGYSDEDRSDINVDTLAAGVSAQLSDFSTATISALYEENQTDLELDTVSLRFASVNAPWSLELGQTYLPFGSFSSVLIQDTLIQTMAETRETAAVAGFSQDGFNAQVYAFNGESDHEDDDTVQNIGARLSYGTENSGIGLDFISNILDSNALDPDDDDADQFPGNAFQDHEVPEETAAAWSANAHTRIGQLSLTVEYLRSESMRSTQYQVIRLPLFGTDQWIWGYDATSSTTRLEALQLEVSYNATIMGRQYTFATAWQETEDAHFLFGMPDKRRSLGAGTALDSKTYLNLEYWIDSDYSESEGGTDDQAENIGIQLSRKL